jgi:pilus assembly protein CpaF
MRWKKNENQINEEYPVESLEETEGDIAVAELEENIEVLKEEVTTAAEKEEGAAPEKDEKKEYERVAALRRELHQQVITQMEPDSLSKMGEEKLKLEIRRQLEIILSKREDLEDLGDTSRLINEILDETFGLGPLEPLMQDPTVSDILINGPKVVYVEKAGVLSRTNITFHDNNHVVQVVQRIASRVGRRVDETCPMVDARLPDGSRVNAIIPPLAIDGAAVSIRRFGASPVRIDNLLDFGSMTEEMHEFLAAAVNARANLIISGGTGSGKTTLLNCLSKYISETERIATIEDAAELQLQQPHIVRMETRAANVEGHGEVSARDLLKNCLRMRPDRIIVGECRGHEALDMLQAMNTGHEGSMTTIHANTPRDAMGRLEMMVGMAGFDLPIWIIRKQVSSAINLVVQASRLRGGKRKVTKVSEITGMEGETLSMHDIFEFKQTGVDEDRAAVGEFWATGIRPKILPDLEAIGMTLSAGLFERRRLLTRPEKEAQ